MKDVLIEWKGMNPSPDTKDSVETTLSGLKYLLPPGSDIRFSIQKFPKTFDAHMIVRSPLGDFAAHGSHKDIFTLSKTLKKNLKQQIFKRRQTHTGWSRAA